VKTGAKLNNFINDSINKMSVSPKKGLKKLKGLKDVEVKPEEPVRRGPKKLEYINVSNKDLAKFNIPTVVFPDEMTLIPVRPKLPPVIMLGASGKQILKTSYSIGSLFNIDKAKNLLIVYDNKGKEYKFILSEITNLSGKGERSIDKKMAQELANTFLKLNIKPQNKKSEFIRQIREKIGLPAENI
jgi:hypothetical protein